MKREFHVRFCEGLKGKILRSTRLVLMGKEIPENIKEELQDLIQRMGLTINEEKTKSIKAREEQLDFLGFTFRYDKSKFESQQHDRLQADLDELASGEEDISPFADILYGEGWRIELNKYKNTYKYGYLNLLFKMVYCFGNLKEWIFS